MPTTQPEAAATERDLQEAYTTATERENGARQFWLDMHEHLGPLAKAHAALLLGHYETATRAAFAAWSAHTLPARLKALARCEAEDARPFAVALVAAA